MVVMNPLQASRLQSLSSHRIRQNSMLKKQRLQRECKLLIYKAYSEKTYLMLKKNANLHLCYLYLMTYDYNNVIKIGNSILRNLKPNQQTRFQVI